MASESPSTKDPAGMDRAMRRVSRGLSAFALALMAAGFVLSVVHGTGLQPLSLDLAKRSQRLMLFGVGVLAVLPGMRVLVALSHYTAARRLAEALVALIVVLELVASMIAGH